MIDTTTASYKIKAVTDNFILLVDLDHGRTVTNDAHFVLNDLNDTIEGGIGKRRVYYRDTMGRYDELKHENGWFKDFAPCTKHQQEFLAAL